MPSSRRRRCQGLPSRVLGRASHTLSEGAEPVLGSVDGLCHRRDMELNRMSTSHDVQSRPAGPAGLGSLVLLLLLVKKLLVSYGPDSPVGQFC